MDNASSHASGDPEKQDESESSRKSLSPAPPVDAAFDQRVWRKLDLWILPVVAMFYFLSFLVSYQQSQVECCS
jgi:hypothetical protein